MAHSKYCQSFRYALYGQSKGCWTNKTLRKVSKGVIVMLYMEGVRSTRTGNPEGLDWESGYLGLTVLVHKTTSPNT